MVSAWDIAIKLDPLDSHAAVEAARSWYSLPHLPLSQRMAVLRLAREAIETAISRDPMNLAHRRMIVQLLRKLATFDEVKSDQTVLNTAALAAQDALALYPTDPRGYRLFGETLIELGTLSRSENTITAAIEALNRALELDDVRPKWEQIRGLRDRERQAIQEKINEARALLRKSSG